MSTPATVPFEEYLHTTYEPDREYVNGQLVERNAGEYFHSAMLGLICGALGARKAERRYHTFISLRVRVSDEPRIRVPDICVKALPYEKTPILVRPNMAIEVISPEDEVSNMLTKIGDYLAAGIPHIWIVDPYKRRLFEVRPPASIRRPPGLTLATPLVGEIDFAPLFQELYEPTG